MTTKLLWAATAAILATAPVSAAVVFDNPLDYSGGDCVFNTTCGPQFTGNTFAAQLFTLSSATTLTGGTFSVYVNDATQPSAVNWLLLSATGLNTPGSVIASGSSLISSRTAIGTQFGYDLTAEGYSLPSVALGAGSYFIAVQGVSSQFSVFLAGASAFNGAFETDDGGASFYAGYRGFNGIAVSLSGGAVPEPASWALMIAGFGLVGAAMRRRVAIAA